MTYSILVVDDDAAIKELVQEYLTDQNYQVNTASSALQALEMLDSLKVDIVLTDIVMLGMDGMELTRKLKNSYSLDIIVMTGYSSEYSYGEAVRAGASDFIFKPFRLEELDLRIKRVLREAAFKNERAMLVKKLEKLAITDALTKLYNSRHFFSQIKTEIERHKRYSRVLSLLILDIDFFKKYNDAWGHLEGDKVLMTIGKNINSCLRSVDTAYRYGGEEFAILLPETRLRKASLVGKRVKNCISSQTFEPEPGITKSITISIGATELAEEDGFKSFISRADKALYQAKVAGRDKLIALKT